MVVYCNGDGMIPLQIPSLIFGPFGCGKTQTICECVMILVKCLVDVRVLVCTHSESAADLCMERLHQCKMAGNSTGKDNQHLAVIITYGVGGCSGCHGAVVHRLCGSTSILGKGTLCGVLHN